MGRSTTSLRLDDDLREKLAKQAASERISLTSLAERLLSQGLAEIEHPGIHFNPAEAGQRSGVEHVARVLMLIDRTQRIKLARIPGTDEQTALGFIADGKAQSLLCVHVSHIREITVLLNAEHASAIAAERKQTIRPRCHGVDDFFLAAPDFARCLPLAQRINLRPLRRGGAGIHGL